MNSLTCTNLLMKALKKKMGVGVEMMMKRKIDKDMAVKSFSRDNKAFFVLLLHYFLVCFILGCFERGDGDPGSQVL